MGKNIYRLTNTSRESVSVKIFGTSTFHVLKRGGTFDVLCNAGGEEFVYYYNIADKSNGVLTFTLVKDGNVFNNYYPKTVIDELLLNVLRRATVGWSASVTFNRGDIVWHAGNYYHCKQDNTTGKAVSEIAYWENINLFAVNSNHVRSIDMEPQYDTVYIGGTITNDGAYRAMTFVQDVYFKRDTDGKSYVYDNRGKTASDADLVALEARVAALETPQDE